MSDGEGSARQKCPCRSPRHRHEISDLGGARSGQSGARPTCLWLSMMAIGESIGMTDAPQ
jgi:hypothetical protein